MKAGKKETKPKTVSYGKYGYLFIAPFFIVYLVFSLWPMINTFYYSMFEYTTRNLRTTITFTGLQNYLNVLGIADGEQGYFLKYLGNTLRLWLLNFVPQILLSLLAAAWLTNNRAKLKARGFYKVVLYMPNIITAASISLLFCALLSKYGPIMSTLRSLGWISQNADIMMSKWGTGISISMIQVWMWYGNTMLLLIAGIIGISPDIYEAAELDGATGRQQFFSITLPLLKPVMLYVLVTSAIGGLQLFDIPALFNVGQGTGYVGGPNDTSTTVTMYIMRLHNTDTGRAAAVSVLLFICTLIISLIPFYLMFVNATRTSTQVQSGISLLFGSNLKNNIANFDKSQQGLGVTVLQSMFNSFKVAVPFTVLSVYFSSMTAYGIHNYSFKGRKAAWAFIMGVMMVPTQVFAIGFYQFMMKLNLLDTYWPLIIPGITTPAVVFFMKQYMEGALSPELVEAARIDGCGEIRIFNTIVVPLMKPAIATQAIFQFVASWNNLFMPTLIISSSEKKTLTMFVQMLTSESFRTDYGVVFLGLSITILPMLVMYFLLSRFIVEGVSLGGVKG